MFHQLQLALLLFGLYCLQGCFAISQDESVRSYLEHFKTTRNNHVSPALKAAARDYIVKTFQDFGLDTWTEEFPSNQKNYSGINIVGRVNGRYTGTSKDKILIIAAHYDTEPGTNGVDDNGSGVTAMLQALRQYKSSNYMECTQNYTLLFVAFDLEEVQRSCQTPPCSCSRGLCGSGYFVANLTRYVKETNCTVQGAYVLDVIMNYNTSNGSQSLPNGADGVVPDQVAWVRENHYRGDWLAVIGRKYNDSELSNKFVANFKQGAFKTLQIPLPFSGRPSDQPAIVQSGLEHFLRSDHTRFWNTNDSWPAVFLTDTADFRGYMKTCYHQKCDNMNQVTPEMITFMGRTADALVGAAQSLTGRVCPFRESCKNVNVTTPTDSDLSIRTIDILSPSYPSEYPNGIECIWFREIKNFYHQRLYIFMNIENSTDCTNDFLEVINERLNVTIGRYCGSYGYLDGEQNYERALQLTISSSVVRVRFVSDALVSKPKGFRIVWSSAQGLRQASRLGLLQIFSVLGVFAFVSPASSSLI